MNRSPVLRTDEQHLVLSAVRYALGRHTYIVGMTVGSVISLWPSLPRPLQQLIWDDVAEALNRDGPLAVSPVDRPEWQRLLDLEVQPAEGD